MTPYETYQEWAAEQAACGYEVVTYDEWCDPQAYKQAAFDLATSIYNNDEQDLY